ncbi:MAG: hypothetical protein Q9222_005929 [Ikaeria aurantiellina]
MRRNAIEARQFRTLQQLKEMQLDEPGFPRIRHRCAVVELEAGVHQPAELEGSTLDITEPIPSAPAFSKQELRIVDNSKDPNKDTPMSYRIGERIHRKRKTKLQSPMCALQDISKSPSMPFQLEDHGISLRFSNDQTLQHEGDDYPNPAGDKVENGRDESATEFGELSCQYYTRSHSTNTSCTVKENSAPSWQCPYYPAPLSPSNTVLAHSSPLSTHGEPLNHSLFAELDHLIEILPTRALVPQTCYRVR